MASINIPETIVGLPLFSPDANNQFSIAVADLPNGDDALRIGGNVAVDYTAYVNAPILSSGIFHLHYSVGMTPWSMSFWFKAPAGAAPATFDGTDFLFGVHNANLALAALSLERHNNNGIWSVCAANTNDIRFVRSNDAGGVTLGFVDVPGVRDGAWHFITINVMTSAVQSNTGSPMKSFVDDDIVGTAGSTAVNGNNSPTNFATFKFTIGPYASEISGFAQEWYMGKFNIHNHQLTETERLLLFNTMTA